MHTHKHTYKRAHTCIQDFKPDIESLLSSNCNALQEKGWRERERLEEGGRKGRGGVQGEQYDPVRVIAGILERERDRERIGEELKEREIGNDKEGGGDSETVMMEGHTAFDVGTDILTHTHIDNFRPIDRDKLQVLRDRERQIDHNTYGDREKGRNEDKDRDRDRDRDRDEQMEPLCEGQHQTLLTKRETERMGETQRDKGTERHRETKRQSNTETQRETQTQRKREKQGETETEIKRKKGYVVFPRKYNKREIKLVCLGWG